MLGAAYVMNWFFIYKIEIYINWLSKYSKEYMKQKKVMKRNRVSELIVYYKVELHIIRHIK